jgi:RNA polymerase sigma-70 factor, ECF subfamily
MRRKLSRTGFKQNETDLIPARIIQACSQKAGVESDDQELVVRCLAGDQQACTRLVEAYSRMVGTVILRVTGESGGVEDLAQETFLRVFRALHYYDARARLSTWIYTIAHRVAIDHLRKAGRWREEPLTVRDGEFDDSIFERQPVSGALDPEAALSREESDTLVRMALAQLPEKYRLPIVYAAMDGLDYPTISAMLGVPVGTIKTLVFRGKRLLKEYIVASLRDRVVSKASDDL